MPRFCRLVVPGYPHHVTQRGVRRQETFFDARDYKQYLVLAQQLLQSHDIEILAYCLMPNHIHAVVIPGQSDSLAAFFGKLHQQYARTTNFRYEWSGHLWQNRFYSVVMDEHHSIAALRYVERNPVRSGLANHPQDWPWSSARGNLGLVDDPLIPGRPALRMISDWAEFLSSAESSQDLKALRRETATGRPYGSDGFISALESATGRRIRKKTKGRKRNR